MGFRPRQKAAGNFTPVPVGSHVAVCSSVIDLGLQGGGKFEPAYKVVIGWELPLELTDAGKPMRISQTYTNSMNKKANLRKVIEAWFGKTFETEDKANEFDLSLLIGRSCLVNVVHKVNGEKTYANVNGVMPLPKGTAKPETTGETLYYAPTDETQSREQISAAYAALPEWVRKKVDEQMTPPAEGGVEEEAAGQAAGAASDMDDDIPF